VQGLIEAVQQAVERITGSILYSHLGSTLLAVAATTRASINLDADLAGGPLTGIPVGAELSTGRLDLLLRQRVALLTSLPQESLGIERALVSSSGWRVACIALGKASSANSPMAQLDCLVHAAELIYDTIRQEHPLASGQSQRVIAADEFTPIFVWVVLHSGVSDLCSVRQPLSPTQYQ
jgi:hypothetical protein